MAYKTLNRPAERRSIFTSEALRSHIGSVNGAANVAHAKAPASPERAAK